MIPVCLGIVPFLGIYLFELCLPSRIVTQLYASGVMTLTVGSIMRGVLDIYGTTNSMLVLYLYAGTALCTAGTVAFVYTNRKAGMQKSRIKEKIDPALAQN